MENEILDTLKFRREIDKNFDEKTNSEKNKYELAFVVSCFKDDIKEREKHYLYFRPSKKLRKSVEFKEFMENLSEDKKSDNMKKFQVEDLGDHFFMYQTDMKAIYNIPHSLIEKDYEQNFLKTLTVLAGMNKKIPIVDIYATQDSEGKKMRLRTPTAREIKDAIVLLSK